MINKVVRNRKSHIKIEDFAMDLEKDYTFAESRILIVDDFVGMRTMIAGVLRDCGAESTQIDAVASSNEALNMLANKQYDIVICDYNLGQGKNGVQILEEAKFKRLISPSCCWLIISAEKSLEGIMGVVEMRPDAYIMKPFTEVSLLMRLKKIKQKKEVFKVIDDAILNENYTKAIELCSERISSDKENSVELFRLKCELLVKTEQFGLAKNLLSALLRRRELPWAQLMLAQIIASEGDYQQAVFLLENIISKNRSYLSAYDELANICCKLNKEVQAESILEKAISLSPKSMRRQQKMGEVAMSQFHFERAERAFRASVLLGENSVFKNPNSYTGLARSLSAQGKMSEALNIVQPLNETFPDNAEITMTSKALEGLIYHENNQSDKAEESARELAKLLQHGSHHLAQETLKDAAILLLNSSKKDLGIQLLQTEIMNNPEDDTTNNWVMDIFTASGLGGQAKQLIEGSRREAMKLMDESALMIHSGDYSKAIEKMRLALKKMPKNARLLFNIAHVLITYMEVEGYKVALSRETSSYLETAHKSAPKESRYNELMKRLENLLKKDIQNFGDF